MLARTSITILLHEKGKHAGIVVGVAMALFLALLQFGFYRGFQRDITIVADSVRADLWVTEHPLLAFDYVAHFDDLPRSVILGDGDVQAAAGLIIEWVRLRRAADGATDSAQLVGFDFYAGVDADFGVSRHMHLPSLLAVPGNVLVDAKHLDRVLADADTQTQGLEIGGLHANVVAAMQGRKLFSTACLIVTDLENARRHLRFPPQRVSYLAVKCRDGADIPATQARLQRRLPDKHVWTAKEFHDLTQNYWTRLTGMGPVLLLSAALAVLVGFLTVFLSFSHLTAEKLPVYAAMKAMGASTAELSGMALLQIGVVFGLGCVLALGGLVAALLVLAHTTISVVLTPGIVALGVGFMALCSVAAGMRSLIKLANLEPGEAFRA
jgi:putative ABC transport system permease protein